MPAICSNLLRVPFTASRLQPVSLLLHASVYALAWKTRDVHLFPSFHPFSFCRFAPFLSTLGAVQKSDVNVLPAIAEWLVRSREASQLEKRVERDPEELRGRTRKPSKEREFIGATMTTRTRVLRAMKPPREFGAADRVFRGFLHYFFLFFCGSHCWRLRMEHRIVSPSLATLR